jgi:hypothetical protein
MSSGTHLKLCLINGLLNTFTALKGEEVQNEGGRRVNFVAQGRMAQLVQWKHTF